MEATAYLQFLAALALVLGLIALAAWLARRFGVGGSIPARRRQSLRLTIVEAITIDAKRRLILVRRDGTEHLLLLGGTDVVVERDIRPPEETPSGRQTDIREAS